MKKFISLAVALAMVLSVCPMLGLMASAATETTSATLERMLYFSNSTHIGETETSSESNNSCVLVSPGGDWSTAGTFTDEDGTVTTQPSLGGSGFNNPRNTVIAFKLPEIDYTKLLSAELTLGIHCVKQSAPGQMLGIYGNSIKNAWSADANGKAALGGDNGVKGLDMLGFTTPISFGSTDKADYKDETVTLSSKKLVSYLKKMHDDGYTEVTFRVANSQGGVWIYNAKHANKPTLKLKTGDIARVTIKTVLSDGSSFGVEDKYIDLPANEEYTQPDPESPLEIDGVYYIFNKEKSELTITPTVGGPNVIKLAYDKFEGTGLTGSVLSEEGATCWFADPRSLTVKNEDGSKNYTYIGYIDVHGAVKATQYDNNTKAYEEVLIRSNFQPDDHDNPTFLELPDHRIMIFYSRHTDEPCFYYRVSKKPYDITTLGEEKRLGTANNTTYPSPFILEDDPNNIYLCWRGVDWNPTIGRIAVPDENGDTDWNYTPTKMIQGGDRPYAKYYSNGKNEIWIAYTYSHPQEDGSHPNWLYFSKVDINSMTLKDVNGNQLSVIANGALRVTKDNASRSFAIDTTDYRDWVWEINTDDDGYPVVAMVKIAGGANDQEYHDYYYARYNGSEWTEVLLPSPAQNTQFHSSNTEHCYSGGMSIDKIDTHSIYCSVPVDGVFGKVWEIVKYTMNDDYTKIDKTEWITSNSRENNVRPYFANGSGEGDLCLTWMNGYYQYWMVQTGWKQGFPTRIMTSSELAEPIITNGLGETDYTVYNGEADNTVDITAGNSFTVSMDMLQSDISKGGTLFESGNLKINLEKQTVDPYDYAAVAPKITVEDAVEKSQNLFSNSDWFADSVGSTGGQKGVKGLGWINYTFTYDGSELITYVNGLIDATMQDVNIELGTDAKIGGIQGVITNFRFSDKVLTQAEIRKAAEDFDESKVNTLEAIDLPDETVTDLVLPVKTADGKDITWSSNDEAVIKNDGAVVNGTEEHTVTLTATYGGGTKEFTVKVLPRDINKNLVLHYDFNEVADGVVPDLSGNNNDAEIKGSKALTANGKLDLTANTKDGWDTNGYLNVPHDILKGVRSYTVAQKISGGTDRNDPRLYDFGTDAYHSMFTRIKTTGNTKNYYDGGIKNSDTKLIPETAVANVLAEGEYWLVTVYSAATKKTDIYTVSGDGELVSKASGTEVTFEPYQIAGYTGRNYIGRAQWWDSADSNTPPANQDFNGTIDDFMFFNTALTEDEIRGLIPAPADADEIDVSLGWNGEDFTIDFDLGTGSGDAVNIYKNGDDNTPVAAIPTDKGTTGVSFFTKDTNALYKAAASSAGTEGTKTEAVSVYSLVADAIVAFAEKNTQISKAQLDKAIEVVNAGGIYIKNGELTNETAKLMDYNKVDGTITLNGAAYGAGLRFANVKGYATSEAPDKIEQIGEAQIIDDGRTIKLEAGTEDAEMIMLEEIEFAFDDDTVDEADVADGEIDFVEEI